MLQEANKWAWAFSAVVGVFSLFCTFHVFMGFYEGKS